MIKRMAGRIIRLAGFVNSLERVLRLGLDDKFVERGMKAVKLLEALEKQAPSILEKSQLSDIREKVRGAMQAVQEAQEDLFSIQQQMVNEEDNKGLLDKE